MSSYPAVWKSPAKLNLFLHVTSKREDGYHNLETLFQFIDLFDEIEIEKTLDGSIKRISGNEAIHERSDIMIKAAHLLKNSASEEMGCRIKIRKQIPMGGGLGGGSSNAATILIALNHLWNLNLSKDQLKSIALELGADVPIFIEGRNSLATGVGENLFPVELDDDFYFVVLNIKKNVSTQEIFSHEALTFTTATEKIPDLLKKTSRRNDCLHAAIETEPEIARALEYLNSQNSIFEEAQMTGTGSSVFARFDNKKGALDAVKDLPPEWEGFVTQPINYSPLYDWAVAKR
jgi:4-diphosphocytidyl-2-C-methyl-D-erythritol kinase